MKLEHIEYPEAGVCRMVLTADAAALERALAEAEQSTAPADGAVPRPDREDLLADAVNRVLLAEFPPLYEQAVAGAGLVPVSDPDFGLRALNRAEGFCATAEFCILPELTLGRYTDFVQQVEPTPLRELNILLEINVHHAGAYNAADEAGKAAIRQQAIRSLYERRCEQALVPARQRLLEQLGDSVHGPVPRPMALDTYLEELNRFSLQLQRQKLDFGKFLQAQHQTETQFRAALRAQAERRLRSRLGLLLVADREGLWPTDAAVEQALENWDSRTYGARTFPANDRRRVRQRLAAAQAQAFVLAHSTLLAPPAEPVLAPADPAQA